MYIKANGDVMTKEEVNNILYSDIDLGEIYEFTYSVRETLLVYKWTFIGKDVRGYQHSSYAWSLMTLSGVPKPVRLAAVLYT